MAMERIIIEGTRNDGTTFRPGDWIDRLSTLLASFGPDHRLHYAPQVQPCVIQGRRCLAISRDLEQTHPDAYRHIIQFARSNDLRIQPDRRPHQEWVEVERRIPPRPPQPAQP